MLGQIQQLGKYQILDELGRGGFGVVYRARDSTLERDIALKVVLPQLLTDGTFVQRFRNEASVCASLRHINIITIYEIGEAEGRLFIAMELASGSSLAQTIVARGRLPWAETLALLNPVCGALDYAHGRGIVHRDLKPANILLDAEHGPLLTDFGFARVVGQSSISLSMSGGIVGTPGYIAPEVWETRVTAPAADIYALGCIVYEMLTGQALFHGETPLQVLRAHDRGPLFSASWAADVPLDIETVLRQAVARDAAERYRSAGALWHALNELSDQGQANQVAIPSPDAVERTITAVPRSDLMGKMQQWLWLIPVVIIVVFLGLIVYFQSFQKTVPITSISGRIEEIKYGEDPQRHLEIIYDEGMSADYKLKYSFPLSDTSNYLGFQFVFKETQNFSEYTDIKISILFNDTDTTCTLALFGVKNGDRSYIDIGANGDRSLYTEIPGNGNERTYLIPIKSLRASDSFKQSEVNGLSIAAEAGKKVDEHEHEFTVQDIEFVR